MLNETFSVIFKHRAFLTFPSRENVKIWAFHYKSRHLFKRYIFCDKDGSDILVELGISSGNKSNSSLWCLNKVLLKKIQSDDEEDYSKATRWSLILDRSQIALNLKCSWVPSGELERQKRR